MASVLTEEKVWLERPTKICRIAECQLFTEVFRPVLKLYNMWEYRMKQMMIQYHYIFSQILNGIKSK